MTEKVMCAMPDYEAENCKLREENAFLRMKMEERETELLKLRAQMEVVFLIFGRRNLNG